MRNSELDHVTTIALPMSPPQWTIAMSTTTHRATTMAKAAMSHKPSKDTSSKTRTYSMASRASSCPDFERILHIHTARHCHPHHTMPNRLSIQWLPFRSLNPFLIDPSLTNPSTILPPFTVPTTTNGSIINSHPSCQLNNSTNNPCLRQYRRQSEAIRWLKFQTHRSTAGNTSKRRRLFPYPQHLLLLRPAHLAPNHLLPSPKCKSITRRFYSLSLRSISMQLTAWAPL